MRDDSSLITGASSASLGVQEIRKEIKEAKTTQRHKLKPAAEIVIAEIDRELSEVSNINYLEIESMLTEEHFKSEMMARKKYVGYLVQLKNKLSNVLREE